MDKIKGWKLARAGILAATSMVLFAGCKDLLIFSTATKFGLDISESSAQQPEINFGYNRVEVVSIPLGGTNSVGTNSYSVQDAGATNDAYSVVGTFSVAFDPSPFTNTAGLHVNDLFATGMAAQMAATNAVMGTFFANNLNKIVAARTNNSN